MPRRPVAHAETDPLAELARLIGQNDPFADFDAPQGAARPRQTDPQPGAPPYAQHADPQTPDYYAARGDDPAHARYADPGTDPGAYPSAPGMAADAPEMPAWLRHFQTPANGDAARYDIPAGRGNDAGAGRYPDDSRYAGDSRYDDVLYGNMPGEPPQDPRYGAPGYGQDGYPPEAYGVEQGAPDVRPRRGGMLTVGLVLALAIVGTAGAYAYRAYFGSPRSGEPPVIKAEPGPNKIVPTPSGDGSGKTITDRIGDRPGGERMVSREEQPVDVKATKPEPRVVFPPLTQPNQQGAPNRVPPTATGSAPAVSPAGDEPKRVRTITIRGDQPTAAPAAAPSAVAAPTPLPPPTTAPVARTAAPAVAPSAPAPAARGPMQISPQQALTSDPRVRSSSASTIPPADNGGKYMVQLSSQRSEADAMTSYRALQAKYPGVLGSRQAIVRRADLGDKGVYYRAMIGPFGSSDEAAQFCANLRTAGGQCVVPR